MTRRPDNPRPGLFIIDRPQGLTSHDVASRARRPAHTRKVGYGGTPSPMATRVPVIGIDKATKLPIWVSSHSKEYRTTTCFGVATSTDGVRDIATAAVGCVSLGEEQLEAVLAPLYGGIIQVPSTVSATRANGKRVYALTRAGNDVELIVRLVRVSHPGVLVPSRPVECMLEEADADNAPNEQISSGSVRVVDVNIVVECSSDTYARALTRDVGKTLGVGAHLTALCRMRVDDVHPDAAITLEELSATVEAITPEGEPDAEPILPLVPLDEAVRTVSPSLLMTEAEVGTSAHGQAPRRSYNGLAQQVVEAGYCPKSASKREPAPIATVVSDDTIPDLLRTDAARLHTVPVSQKETRERLISTL